MISESSDNPPAHDICSQENRKHDRGENGYERAAKENDFESGTDEYRSVKQNHPAESRFFDLCGAARNHLLLMAARNLQLRNAKQSYGHEQAQKRDDA